MTRCGIQLTLRAKASARSSSALRRPWSTTSIWSYCAAWLTMTQTCSVTSTPARWLRGRLFAGLSLLALLALLGGSFPCRAQDVAALVKAYREGPTRARRTTLERFATAHPKDQSGAAAHLALGAVAFDQKDYPSAVFHLKAAQVRLAKLSDYSAYYAASAHAQAKEFPQTLQALADLKA